MLKNHWAVLAASLVCLVSTIAPVAAADKDEAADAAIREATAKFVTAFNARDTKTMTSLLTDDGDYQGDEGQAVSFKMQLARMAKDERTETRTLTMSIAALRLVGAGVALADGATSLKVGAGPTIAGRYSAVWLKSGDRWRIDAIREARTAPVISAQSRLQELEWLVGDWVEEGGKSALSMSVAWSKDKNFLIREIHASLKGDHTATQRIGWDPLAGQFKSWTFMDDGSYSEGLWEREGKGWVVDSSGAMIGGKPSISTVRYEIVNDHTIVLESEDALVDGKPLPNFKIRLIHKPAK